MGATCSYFCESGWQKKAPTNYNGGYLYTVDSGSQAPGDVYDNLIPTCLLPVGCSKNCTLALRSTMSTCSDYINSFTAIDRAACVASIQAVSILCSNDSYSQCVEPVADRFAYDLHREDLSNTTNPVAGPGQTVS